VAHGGVVANHHYGNFGDVVKHLVLAQLLHDVRPKVYMESHGGAAEYPLTAHQPVPRPLDVHAYLRVVDVDETLASAPYTQALRRRPERYPGSTTIAVDELANDSEYLVCETDDSSARSLLRYAADAGVQRHRFRAVRTDGLAAVSAAAAHGAFVFLDPFELTARVGNGPDTPTAHQRVRAVGAAVVCWYPLLCEKDIAMGRQMIPADQRVEVTVGPDQSDCGLYGCAMTFSATDRAHVSTALNLLHRWRAATEQAFEITVS
jgi:23S rRNA A2030 N6-methylase RlmJ